MSKVISGSDPGAAFMALLKSWGAPDHLTGFSLKIEMEKPVEATCSFYATGADGELLVVDDAFVEELKRYHFVEIEDPAQP